MHLKSLTLKGFKSFASATTLKFEPGICAVVGPNGSGKSNVVDALAWVMGEQGAKTLRGGKMQDVIFAGAGDRKPLGRAEVTLTIDNSDGALDIDYSEVSITRRMFRDGASEYEINGAKARLMDIQELLSDSGIGREMHVIVGQGRLAQILESRPEERRAFIEEAAGVLKHRRRKEKAQRKLVGMQANVDRLHDLTDELKRQLKPLARQAQAASRAATVQATVRQARLVLAADQITTLRAQVDSSEHDVALVAEQLAEVTAQADEAAARREELERVVEELEPKVAAAQHRWFDCSALFERTQATERIARERASNTGQLSAYQGPDPEELQARADQADAQLEQLEQQVAIATERCEVIADQAAEVEQKARDAEREHMAQVRAIADRREGVIKLIAAAESLEARREQAAADAESLEEQAEEAFERVEVTRRALEQLVDTQASSSSTREPLAQADAQAQSEAKAAEARVDELTARERELERTVSRLQATIDTLGSQVRQQSASAADHVGTLAPVAEFLSAEDGFDKALASALGDFASAFVARDVPASAHKLAEALAGIDDAAVDRVALLSPGNAQSWRLDIDLPAGASWLLDHVDFKDSDGQGHGVSPVAVALNRILVDVAVVESTAQAIDVVVTEPRLRVVTPSGRLFGQGWCVVGQGSPTPVEVGADIARAQAQLAAVTEELEQMQGTLAGARTAAQDARIAAATATSRIKEHDAAVTALEREHNQAANAHEHAKKAHEKITARLVAAQQRVADIEQQLAEANDRLERVEQPEDAEEPSTAERDQAQAELAQIKAMEMEARLSVRTAEERAHQARGRGEALRRQAQQSLEARAAHDKAMAAKQHQARVAEVVMECATILAQRLETEISEATATRDQLAEQKNTASAALAQAKDAAHTFEVHKALLSDKNHAADVARSRAQVRAEEAEATVVEQLGLSVEELLADNPIDEDFDREHWQRTLKKAEKDLQALGKVNPLALEEYKALQERFEYLNTQLADVEQARADLRDVINEVDDKILQLFSDAWADVEGAFPEVFSTLFPGGEGRLVLTDPDDMLTTGIEVEARPPGKRVKRLSLLSGGEKSLTALAMLVAIFKARPSPFYVMDEVEAALDDVNLRRLINLFEQLRQSSQLIVITHQKPTMDVANVLYGVTMRGDGVTRVISQRMSPA
ncbi:chromosome segregation protein SMC [Corynebacterium argentoratense]|uniref:chromosome segregation protein SMC n=1 Tax=Corynebacterium argentoratense TaxID=42817 RepID=UPI0028E45B18|nr:chromosome segregation protein SMC [Corynebacterium argentoratense]